MPRNTLGALAWWFIQQDLLTFKGFHMNKEQKYLNKQFEQFNGANSLKLLITGWRDNTLTSSHYLTITKEQLEQIQQILIDSK